MLFATQSNFCLPGMIQKVRLTFNTTILVLVIDISKTYHGEICILTSEAAPLQQVQKESSKILRK